MRAWPRRIRGAIGMGLTWAVAWALTGIAIGAASLVAPGRWSDSLFAVYDAPLPTLALPGFVGGVLFSLVLGVAARRRRFDELSMARFVAWGAAGGLLLALVPAAMAVLGLATPVPGFLALTAVIAGPLTLASAGSAAATLALARRAERRAQRLTDGGRRPAALRSPAARAG